VFSDPEITGVFGIEEVADFFVVNLEELIGKCKRAVIRRTHFDIRDFNNKGKV
jgi:hypothetical protein